MGLDFFFFLAVLCERVLCVMQLLPCLTLGAEPKDGSSCLSSPRGSSAAQDFNMASGRLGSGRRDFPFLTIIGNGTTGPRHSPSALYGIQQTGQEHPSASAAGAGWVLALGSTMSGVLWVVMRTSPTVLGCGCITTVSNQITRKSRSRSLSILNTLKLKPLVWKVDNYCARFSLTLDFRMKLCANCVKINFSAAGTIYLTSDRFLS